MNRYFLLSILLAFALFGSACGSVSTAAKNSSANDAMAPALELALGTLKLEETDQAVDAETAAQLLPLWQLISELNVNSSTAGEEINAVVDQIEATMTAGQLKAISDMQISQQDITAAQHNGTASNANAGTSNAQTAAGGGIPPSEASGIQAGGIPPDIGGAPGGPTTSGGVSSAQSTSSTNSNPLIEQVVKLLQSKISS